MFSTGIMIVPKGPVGDVLAVCQAAEGAGFDVCLLADEGFNHDVYVMMAAVVLNTQRLRVAPITNPYTRHPAVTAAGLASISALAPGRAFLSLVAGGSLVLGPMNLKAEKPALACRETIHIVRELLSGNKCDYQGSMFRLTGAQLETAGEPIEIWVMGRGPKMTKMAAEVADVAVVTGKMGLEGALDEAQTGGRALKLAMLGSMAFNQAMLDRMRPNFTYVLPDAPAEVWRRFGLAPEWVAELKRVRERQGVEAATRLIDDDLLRQLMVAGTPEECAADIRRLTSEKDYAYFVLPVMSLDRDYALPLIRQAADIYARAR
jgi:5,10-methylenetetrahydromethanopterin reductase